jgi:hypothetical protein
MRPKPSSSSPSSPSDDHDGSEEEAGGGNGVVLVLRAHADEASLARTLEAHERLLLLRRRELQQQQQQASPSSPIPNGGSARGSNGPCYASLAACRNLLLQDGAFPQGWCASSLSARRGGFSGGGEDAACWLLLPLTGGTGTGTGTGAGTGTAAPTLLLSQWMAARPPLTRALHAHRCLLRERARAARRRARERRRQRQERGEEEEEEQEDEDEEEDKEPLPPPPPGINSLAVAEDLATRLRIAVQVCIWCMCVYVVGEGGGGLGRTGRGTNAGPSAHTNANLLMRCGVLIPISIDCRPLASPHLTARNPNRRCAGCTRCGAWGAPTRPGPRPPR